MLQNKLGLWVVVVLVSLTGSLSAQDVIINPGETVTVEFERPDLGHDFPPDAEWLNGTGEPVMYEDDPADDDEFDQFRNENDGQTISVDISNVDGDLIGPDGDTLNGFGEGDCIEVAAEWTYTYPVVWSVSISVGGDFGLEIERRFTFWKKKQYKELKDVCPC